jgi:hypothetical protein
MAKKPDGAAAGTQRVTFTRPAAERIARVVRHIEAGDRDSLPIAYGMRGAADAKKIFRVCTFTGAWAIDTDKTVTFRGVTATPNTVSVINKIVSLPAPASTNTSRIVNVAKDGTAWYLVSFQMSTATAVFSGRTQTITFVGTHATQTVAFATPGESVPVLTNISAVLNSSNCSITVNKTTTSVRVVGSTQTATIMSMSGTQTAVITTGTYTATYITLEI